MLEQLETSEYGAERRQTGGRMLAETGLEDLDDLRPRFERLADLAETNPTDASGGSKAAPFRATGQQ
jgi:hypothetical protein